VYVTRDAAPGEYAVLWLDNTASGEAAELDPEPSSRTPP